MAKKRRSKRRAPPKPRRAIKKYMKFERELIRFQKEMISELQEMVKQRIVPRLNELATTNKQKRLQTNLDNDGNEMESIVDLVESQFLGRFSRRFIRSNIKQTFLGLGEDVTNDLAIEFGDQSLSVDLDRTIVDNSVRNSLGKIDDLNRQAIGNIRAEISQGIANGDRWEQIAKRLVKPLTSKPKKGEKATPFQKAVSRAKFIARNEVTSTLGEINKQKQSQAGIQLYRWQTAEDERVRPTHQALNDGIYSWEGKVKVNGVEYEMAVDRQYSDSGTIPGEPWNCRCVAIPYIPEVE